MTGNELDVPAINRDAYLQEDAAHAQAGGTASLRAGVSTPVLLVVDENDAGAWTTIAGVGRLWTATIHAQDARGLRVHFDQAALTPGAELWVYSPKYANSVQGPMTGGGPYGDGEFWSTVIAGETVVVELFVPSGANSSSNLIIDDLMYLYRSPEQPFADDPFAAREGPCHCDVLCYPAYQPLHNATGRVLFVDQGFSIFCSGVLLNTLANDQTPLFLSANHCCGNQVVARTAVVWWYYQSLSCNGTVPQLANVPSSADADFLAGSSISAGSDYTLVQLRGALPNGLTWAGWDASGVLPDGSAVAVIHHPNGAFKRIMFGDTIPYPFSEFYDPSNFWGVGWSSCGTIELGSSGSPLYRVDTQQFVGQTSHTSGPVGCENLYGPAGYGKFAAYYPTIQPFLQAGTDDALEGAGNGTCATATVLGSGTFNDLVVKRSNDDWYRIQMVGCDTLSVTATFNNDYGNVELELYDACGGALLSSSVGTGNLESVGTAAGGGARPVWLRVFMSYGVRNTYSLAVELPGGCPGDLNCNGATDLTDLSILLANYGSTNGTPAQGDLNGDHLVDMADLSSMLAAYGLVCP